MDSKNVLFHQASRNALMGPCGLTVLVCQKDVLAEIMAGSLGNHV